ncbi:MAG TPA: pyrroloquinoline quinone biosynthesis peptide chaperone PqqD [Candidatus Acidoferrales bacterium]|nr:pyrroloquinoline quinone biosynthesis peptide chaperone PqqD [Candidatus Acidoferrales bacterium]
MNAPALAPGVRFRRSADGQGALLIPEGVVNLNDSAAAIVELLDGQRTVDEIAALLAERYGIDLAVVRSDIEDLVQRLSQKLWLVRSTARTP